MSVARDGIQKDPMAVMAALGDEAKQFVEGGWGTRSSAPSCVTPS